MHHTASLSLSFALAAVGLSTTALDAQSCRPQVWTDGSTCIGDTFQICTVASPGCDICIFASDRPGPFEVLGFTFQVMPPVFVLLKNIVPPGGEPICQDLTIPNEPGLIGFRLYYHGTGLLPNNYGSFALGDSGAITVCRPPVCEVPSSLRSNFNGTAIAAGSYVWFNAVVDVSGISGDASTCFENQRIDFVADGVPYSVTPPRSRIEFSTNATQATTTFDPSTREWHTVVPAGYSGNVFAGGFALPVTQQIDGGVNPVTWSGTFCSDVEGAAFHWKWAAAVYTCFPSDPNAIGVKPIDGSQLNAFANSHHAGTPEFATNCVVGGARGGGGSNFTGSYSGSTTASCR